MKDLTFFQELAEGRLYHHRDVLEGKKVKDLAKVVFLMIMILEIMRYEDKSKARSYAYETMEFNSFDMLRMTGNDLHNLLAVINNQLDYLDKIEVDPSISLPELQIKRYLRDIINNRHDITMERRFFLKLEDFLGIRDVQYKTIRRTVLDWKNSPHYERNYTKELIKRLLNTFMQQRNDLVNKF